MDVEGNAIQLTPGWRPQPRLGARIFIAALLLGVTTAGTLALWLGVTPGGGAAVRGAMLVLAAVCFALPGRVVWVSVRRRFSKGHWRMTAEDRAELYAKLAAQKPGLLTRIVGSRWFDVGNATIDCFGAGIFWFQLISGRSRDWPTLFCAVVWTLLAGVLLQQIWRKRRTTRTAQA